MNVYNSAVQAGFQVITGALGYTGKVVAEQLLEQGVRLRTLTNSPNRPNPFGDAIEINPLAFDDPELLTRSLAGADVLYNTYWVRFNHKHFTFEQAVTNTKMTICHKQTAYKRQEIGGGKLNDHKCTGMEHTMVDIKTTCHETR